MQFLRWLWYNKGMRKLGMKKGFTLVELSLSIAFIAILSITIALIINDAISTYRRGLTLNQINTVGMDLVDDMRSAIQGSPSEKIIEMCEKLYGNNSAQEDACKSDNGRKFVLVRKFANNSNKIKIKGKDVVNVPLYGAFCTGAYSYVWNSGYLYTEDNSGVSRARLLYKYEGSDLVAENFRLIKARDENRNACKGALEDGRYFVSDSNDFSIGEVGEEPEVLLSDSNNNALALYSLYAPTPAKNEANTMFYSVSFILGTVQGGIDVMSSGNFCATPSEYESNFDYCAINKFNFAVQANGG